MFFGNLCMSCPEPNILLHVACMQTSLWYGNYTSYKHINSLHHMQPHEQQILKFLALTQYARPILSLTGHTLYILFSRDIVLCELSCPYKSPSASGKVDIYRLGGFGWFATVKKKSPLSYVRTNITLVYLGHSITISTFPFLIIWTMKIWVCAKFCARRYMGKKCNICE